MPTEQDVKDYLGIDWTDEATERRLTRLISIAERYLEGALGVSFPRDNELAHELALIVIADLYDNHTMNEKVSGNVRRLVDDFSMQIKLGLRYQSVIITITSAPTVAGDITLSLNGEDIIITVDPAVTTTVEALAELIRATNITGWGALADDSAEVTLVKSYGFSTIAPTFNGGTTGATAEVVKK